MGQLLRFLGISLAPRMLSGLARTVLVATDDHAYRAKIVTQAAVISLVISVPLAATFGAAGACARDHPHDPLPPVATGGAATALMLVSGLPVLLRAGARLLGHFAVLLGAGYFRNVIQALSGMPDGGPALRQGAVIPAVGSRRILTLV